MMSTSDEMWAPDWPAISFISKHLPQEIRSVTVPGNFLMSLSVLTYREDVMKDYFTNLPMKIWLLFVIPAVVVAYPVVRIVVPAVVQAVIPEVVRSVLSVI